MVAKLNKRKCKHCKELFQKMRPLQACCGPNCAIAHNNILKSRENAQKAIRERAERKKKINSMKGINELTKEAQIAFNAFIRLRDKDQLCICCDKPYGTNNLGGDFDCGHWRSRGAAPHLRFNEDNAHGQRKYCNMYRDGNPIGMRLGMIKRIGLGRVEALENNNEIHKWTKDELIAIKLKYKQLTKELKNAN
jgi:hypothetical protein